MKKFTQAILVAMLTFTTVAMTAQIKTPAPSPLQTIKQDLGLTEIEVTYSRPSAKGRVIFGDLVPFDKMWRTGANASTKVKIGDALTFNGNKVDKGEYALYTIPGKTEWTIILYKDITCWGLCDEMTADKEAARFTVKPTMLTQSVETFSMSIMNLTNNGATLRMQWEKTAVDIKIEQDVDSKVMASIDAFVNPKPDYRSYFNAAAYYLEAGKDLNKALEWSTKAFEINQGFWVSHQKAKILMGLKNYKAAIETAEISKKAALEAKNSDYVALNEKLIEKAKAGK